MLKPCPECRGQVSSKAITCPHCGYPLKNITKSRPNNRMRLPNSFGSITQIRNRNLRKPFYARVTVGKTETGRCIQVALKPESYFKTYNDAYAALVSYHQNPYDLQQDITIEELYERWSKEKFEKLAEKSITNIINAWSYCGEISSLKVRELKPRHIKYILEHGTKKVVAGPDKGKVKSPSEIQKKKIKSLFNNMLDYAVEYELVDRNCARTFSADIDDSNRSYYHIPFTLDEVDKLRACGTNYAYMVISQCYLGLRPGELCDILASNVNLQKKYIICGMKTESGIDRIVPIHSQILNIITDFYNKAVETGSEYLFTNEYGDKLEYHTYLKHFRKLVVDLELNPDHKPHDPRMTFITYAKESKIDEFALKRIVGHSFKNDITESVYTKRPYTWLCEEMEKVRFTNNALLDDVV